MKCFGLKGNFKWQTTQKSHQSNLEASYRDDFADILTAKFQALYLPVNRIHAVGDFYDATEEYGANDPAAYIKKITQVVDSSPYQHFFAYTRTWIVDPLRVALRELGRRDNFTLLLSMDNTMPVPDRFWKGFMRTWMAVSDLDAPRAKVDVTFRAGSRKIPMKKDIAGNQVCPAEQNVKRKHRITCTNCGICYGHVPVYSIERPRETTQLIVKN